MKYELAVNEYSKVEMLIDNRTQTERLNCSHFNCSHLSYRIDVKSSFNVTQIHLMTKYLAQHQLPFISFALSQLKTNYICKCNYYTSSQIHVCKHDALTDAKKIKFNSSYYFVFRYLYIYVSYRNYFNDCSGLLPFRR